MSGVLTSTSYLGGATYQNAEIILIYTPWSLPASIGLSMAAATTISVFPKNFSGVYQQIYMHASNAENGGSQAEEADGWFSQDFSADGPSAEYPNPYYYHNSALPEDPYPPAWDKSSDVNVQIEGVPVPEPSAILLLGVGLFGLVVTAKRARE